MARVPTPTLASSHVSSLSQREQFLEHLKAEHQYATNVVGGIYHQTMLRIEAEYLKAEAQAAEQDITSTMFRRQVGMSQSVLAAEGVDYQRISAVARMGALQQRAGFITSEMQRLGLEVYERTQQRAPHAVALGQDYAKREIHGITSNFQSPNRKQIGQAAARWGTRGTVQGEWVDHYAGNASQHVLNRITTGIVLGEHPQAIARAIRDEMTAPRAYLDTYARTELMNAARYGQMDTFRENSDVVQGWIWTATEGPGTCECCWAMDGTEHSLEEELDSHPNCMCVAVPTTLSADVIIAEGVAAGEGAITDMRSFEATAPNLSQVDALEPELGSIYDQTQREEVQAALRKVAGDPEAEVKIYRVVRENVPEQRTLTRTDSVYLSRDAAENQAGFWAQGDAQMPRVAREMDTMGAPKVITDRVPARDLKWNDRNPVSAYYYPPPTAKDRSWRLAQDMGKSKIPKTSAEAFDSLERFRAMPIEHQIKVLGPTKYTLLNEGKITLRDLVQKTWSDTWGPGIRPTTLGELRRLGIQLPAKAETITVKAARQAAEAELAALEPWQREVRSAMDRIDMETLRGPYPPRYLETTRTPGFNQATKMSEPGRAQAQMDAVLDLGKALDEEAQRRLVAKAAERERLESYLDLQKARGAKTWDAQTKADKVLWRAEQPFRERIAEVDARYMATGMDWEDRTRLIGEIRREMKLDAEVQRLTKIANDLEAKQKAIKNAAIKARERLAVWERDTYRQVLADAGVDFGGSYAYVGRPGGVLKGWIKDAESYLPRRWKVASDALMGSNRELHFAKVQRRGRYFPHQYVDAFGDVSQVQTTSMSVTAHELTHRAEDTVPEIKRLEALFYQYRTRTLTMPDGTVIQRSLAGDQMDLVKLSKIYPGVGYERDELTRPDHWSLTDMGQYAGKDYGGAFYELLTMGWGNGIVGGDGFFDTDPEFRRWTLAMMRLTGAE